MKQFIYFLFGLFIGTMMVTRFTGCKLKQKVAEQRAKIEEDSFQLKLLSDSTKAAYFKVRDAQDLSLFASNERDSMEALLNVANIKLRQFKSAVNFSSVTNGTIEVPVIVEVPGKETIVQLPGVVDTVYISEAKKTFSFSDNFLSLSGEIKGDGDKQTIGLDYQYKDSYSVITYTKSKLFKRPEMHGVIKPSNPKTDITDLQTFKITSPKPKIVISVGIGYAANYDIQNKAVGHGPVLGLFIGKPLFLKYK